MKKTMIFLAVLAFFAGCAVNNPQSATRTPHKGCDCMKQIKEAQAKSHCGMKSGGCDMKNMPKDANHMNHHEGGCHMHKNMEHKH